MNEPHDKQPAPADGETAAPVVEADKPPLTAEEKVAAAEHDRAEMRERMLRIAADFENFKKRSRREQSDAEAKSRENVLRDMLDVVDNLERAVSFNDNSDLKAIQQGVQLVLRLFQSRLERYQVRPFEAQGKPFDPRVHEAVAQVPSAEVPPGSVLKELMKGYTIGDRLLRPAAVAVALAPKPAAGEGDTGSNGAGAPDPATGEGPPVGED